MRVAVIAFSENGHALAKRVSGLSQSPLFSSDISFEIYDGAAKEFSEYCFNNNIPALFIGALGICIRSIAPYMDNKLKDIPVLNMDEMGTFVIPVLSGHMGGGNELARELSEALGAIPVITTATDVRNDFAIDMFAKRNNLRIVNKDGIAKVSKKVLSGHPITMLVSNNALPVDVEIMDYRETCDSKAISEWKGDGNKIKCGYNKALLCLAPKEYVIGIGCRKDKSAEDIKAFVEKCLEEAGINIDCIAYIASIDLKKEERGIIDFARANGIVFVTYSADELNSVEGEFEESEFVRDKTGVGNVCEKAAVLCGGGELVYKKKKGDGITVAIAKRDWRLNLNE